MVPEQTSVKSQPPGKTHASVVAPTRSRLDRVGILLVVLSAIGFGTLGIFGKLAYTQNFTVLNSLVWRCGGGAAVLWIGLFISQTGQPKRRGGSRQSAIAAFSLGAIVYTTQAILFFGALTYMSAGVTALMFYTYPAFVAIAHWIVTRQPMPRWHLGALALTLIGCIWTVDWQQTAVHPLGIALGLAAGCTYAIYLMLSARLLKTAPPVATAAYMLSGATAVIGSLAISQQEFGWPTNWTQGGIVAGLAIVATALPIVMLFNGLKRLDVVPAAILSTLEPIAAVLLGLVWLGESLWWGQLIGGAFILTAALLLQLKPHH
ncbi:EamA family transporter [filamentous cyanobacterium LEGE 11480]|uniref:EamA family transporter n=1 Tax=Romeriopsis navalis LEGE 11480 TaxID=2777977 RepID=A0A928Z4J9_9CYAN|nr:DMT family transporter [Romeriopsis navalis]MBE9031849.1 EamA family transporter [Romeriopsis navalis LEGE 11480]